MPMVIDMLCTKVFPKPNESSFPLERPKHVATVYLQKYLQTDTLRIFWKFQKQKKRNWLQKVKLVRALKIVQDP